MGIALAPCESDDLTRSGSRDPMEVRPNHTPADPHKDGAVDAVVRVFQPRIHEPISRDRAVAMHTSLFGFFNELLSWKREDDAKARAAGGAQ